MTLDLSPRERIIIALDVGEVVQAETILSQAEAVVGKNKIGLEAISAGIGHALGDRVIEGGGSVFWDGKWKDIPNTVAGATKSLIKRLPRVWAFNVHASGGREMMEAAVQNKGDSKVLAVTVLTSLDDEKSHHLYGRDVKSAVLQMAYDAKDAGVDGIICSPQEVEMLRSKEDLANLLFVTPAIRPIWSVPNDQARPTTPRDAIFAGSTHLVIGRPITNPPGGRSIGEAVGLVVAEVGEALTDLQKHRIV